ncbi:MAG: hypothetical protein GF411_20015 [Candidatus Lokiarchaeota archaeon]|nr:hypothetical protein [Candidatus Lokiarchaeota archaeon]
MLVTLIGLENIFRLRKALLCIEVLEAIVENHPKSVQTEIHEYALRTHGIDLSGGKFVVCIVILGMVLVLFYEWVWTQDLKHGPVCLNPKH